MGGVTPKNIFTVLVLMVVVFGFTGCAVLLVGAGAGGAVLWQGGKVISQETVSVERAVGAIKSVFKARDISLMSEVIKEKVVQLRGEDKNSKKVAVDVFKMGSREVRIEIRVGLGEEQAARELLREIKMRF